MIERLKDFIEKEGLSVRSFESSIGASNGLLRKAIANSTDIQSKWISFIAENYPQLNLDWLLTGKGEMLKKDDTVSIQKHPLKTDIQLHEQAIPLFETFATAGAVSIFADIQSQQKIDELIIPNAPACDGALYVRGDSMYPILKAGDIVCFRVIHSLERIVWGETYLVDMNHDGEDYLLLKYIQKSEIGKDHICLVSQNAHHQPLDVPKSAIRAIAHVKISVRYNTMR